MNMETNAERLERLSRQRGNDGSDVHRHAAIKVDDFQWLIEQAGENARLRKALAFYADWDNYDLPPENINHEDYYEYPDRVTNDRGKIAKAALEGK